MSHQDHHHDARNLGTKRLSVAVGINVLLTVAQIVAGVVSGSLALVADALHNFSDAGGLLLALVARRISRKPADELRTFGYGRAEIVGGLINLTSIIVIAGYLMIEAVNRIFDQPKIEGWLVIVVAAFALAVDIGTAVLTYSMSKHSINIKAAFLHNVADALASVGVILSGVIIYYYELYWIDIAATLAISLYIIWISWSPIKKCISILMQSVPEGISINDVAATIQNVEGVENVAHLHIWPIDESNNSLEAHVGISSNMMIHEADNIRSRIRENLVEAHEITHATIELCPARSTGNKQLIVDH